MKYSLIQKQQKHARKLIKMRQTYLSIGKEGVQNNPQQNKRGEYKVCYSNPENTPRKPVKSEILVS